jgi:tetratricopeptide (TPR) repeat protein
MLGLLLDAEGSSGRVGVATRLAERVAAAYRALGPDHPTVPAEPATRADPRARPELDTLEAALAEARQYGRPAGDPLAIGLAAYALAMARRQAGERGGYLPLFIEARDSFRACGARILEMWTLKNIGLVRFKQRRYAEATEILRRCQAILDSFGGDVEQADTTTELAMACVEQGRYAEAESLTTELLDHARLLGHRWDEGRALDAIAALRRARGDVTGAAAAYTEALAVWQAVGAPGRVTAAAAALAELRA